LPGDFIQHLKKRTGCHTAYRKIVEAVCFDIYDPEKIIGFGLEKKIKNKMAMVYF
jgi:hypothetical protein